MTGGFFLNVNIRENEFLTPRLRRSIVVAIILQIRDMIKQENRVRRLQHGKVMNKRTQRKIYDAIFTDTMENGIMTVKGLKRARNAWVKNNYEGHYFSKNFVLHFRAFWNALYYVAQEYITKYGDEAAIVQTTIAADDDLESVQDSIQHLEHLKSFIDFKLNKLRKK